MNSGHARREGKARNEAKGSNDANDANAWRGANPPKPDPSAYRSREGPTFARPSSPAWDVTSVRVRREEKDRFDRFRLAASQRGRVLPHWEAFALLMDEAGAPP